MGNCSLMPQSYVLLSEFPRPIHSFRRGSAFSSGTGNVFRALVRSTVAGPPTFCGPATHRPVTCNAPPRSVRIASLVRGLSVPGPSVFRPRSMTFPSRVRIFSGDLRHFSGTGALYRRRSPHILRTCNASPRDLQRPVTCDACHHHCTDQPPPLLYRKNSYLRVE